MMREIVVQDCGCISLPDDVAAGMGMEPGARLSMTIDEVERRVTLVAVGQSEPIARAACPIKA